MASAERSAARLIALVVLILLADSSTSLRASVKQRDLKSVGVTAGLGGVLPLDTMLQGEDSVEKPLRSWLGSRPSVWILADYTCKSLCGPVISMVSDALASSGLRPGTDYRLVVVGLDPRDTAADAARMKQAQVTRKLSAASYFLRGDSGAIGALTGTFGFSSVYDRDRDQFAHPAAAFVITPDGRVARTLSGLAVDPSSLRLAITDAAGGTIGTLTDHIRLLCYGYDPASGTYSLAIGRLLAAGAGATITALVLLIGLLLRREHAGRRNETIARRSPEHAHTPTID